MKILGFSCGRKMGNSEVLLKEALMGAEELGVDVEILRLLDLDVRPCVFCKVCLWRQKGPESCVIKDDAAFVWEKIMDSDGLIISAPVYSLTPPGYLLQIRDRAFGPKVDVGFMMGRKKQKAQGREIFVDERCFKTRAGALISHGGSVTPNWLSFGLPLLHTMTFPPKIVVVDQMEVLGTGSSFPEGVASGPPGACLNEGQVVLNEKAIARARKLGRHVAKAMGKPAAQMEWMGDEPGMCPVCHLNQLTITKKNPIECPICGISGELKIKNGEITVTFSEKEQRKSRLTLAGSLEHWDEYHPANQEIAYESQQTSTIPQSQEKQLMNEIAKKLEKYKSYKTCIKPPSKMSKKATVQQV